MGFETGVILPQPDGNSILTKDEILTLISESGSGGGGSGGGGGSSDD
jgi:hypothetical protein